MLLCKWVPSKGRFNSSKRYYYLFLFYLLSLAACRQEYRAELILQEPVVLLSEDRNNQEQREEVKIPTGQYQVKLIPDDSSIILEIGHNAKNTKDASVQLTDKAFRFQLQQDRDGNEREFKVGERYELRPMETHQSIILKNVGLDLNEVNESAKQQRIETCELADGYYGRPPIPCRSHPHEGGCSSPGFGRWGVREVVLHTEDRYIQYSGDIFSLRNKKVGHLQGDHHEKKLVYDEVGPCR